MHCLFGRCLAGVDPDVCGWEIRSLAPGVEAFVNVVAAACSKSLQGDGLRAGERYDGPGDGSLDCAHGVDGCGLPEMDDRHASRQGVFR